jgi:hypothetical protein
MVFCRVRVMVERKKQDGWFKMEIIMGFVIFNFFKQREVQTSATP